VLMVLAAPRKCEVRASAWPNNLVP
jgi:hypothetical protein